MEKKRIFIVATLLLFSLGTTSFASIGTPTSMDRYTSREIKDIKANIESQEAIIENPATGEQYISDIAVEKISETDDGSLQIAVSTEIALSKKSGKILAEKKSSFFEDIANRMILPVYADSVDEYDSGLRYKFTFYGDITKVATVANDPTYYGNAKWKLVKGNINWKQSDSTWTIKKIDMEMGQWGVGCPISENKFISSPSHGTNYSTGFSKYISSANGIVRAKVNVTFKRTYNTQESSCVLYLFLLDKIQG